MLYIYIYVCTSRTIRRPSEDCYWAVEPLLQFCEKEIKKKRFVFVVPLEFAIHRVDWHTTPCCSHRHKRTRYLFTFYVCWYSMWHNVFRWHGQHISRRPHILGSPYCWITCTVHVYSFIHHTTTIFATIFGQNMLLLLLLLFCVFVCGCQRLSASIR